VTCLEKTGSNLGRTTGHSYCNCLCKCSLLNKWRPFCLLCENLTGMSWVSIGPEVPLL